MKITILLLALFFILNTNAQYNYEVSTDYPFGQANPEAPKQIKDFENLIGVCNCKSMSRKPDGSWAKAVDMIWKWKYIMNGMAVQDETLKVDGKHSGSIRQFNADSSKWYVHYYASSSYPKTLPSWEGHKNTDGKIILYRSQKAPNGTSGFSRLTFYDITKSGFKWIGEWVDESETIVYPFWKIECSKKE